MKTINSLIMILLFCSFGQKCNSQTYIGKNGLGKMEFINDSVCKLNFIQSAGISRTTKCTYYTIGDTVFLTSLYPRPFNIHYIDSATPYTKDFCLVVKKYKKRNNKYILSQEGCFATLDTLYDRIIIQNFGLEANDIIVLQYYWVYIRFKIDSQIQKDIKDIVLENIHSIDEVIFFNKFPLLKKRGKLIPCGSKEQLEECWLYSGFHFPIMKKTRKCDDFKEVPLQKIGLLELPYFEHIDGY